MKKITLLLSLTFLIFSCSDDEGSDIVDEPVISQPIVDEPIATGTLTSNLIGTWSRISSTADGVDNQSSD